MLSDLYMLGYILIGICITIIVIGVITFFLFKKRKVKIKARNEEMDNYENFERISSKSFLQYDDIIDTPSGGIIVAKKGRRYLALLSSVSTEWNSASIEDKVMRIKSEISRTNLMKNPMQIWQYTKSVNLEPQIQMFEKRYDELVTKVLDLQAEFEELKAAEPFVEDDDMDVFYKKVKNKRKELFATDEQRKNIGVQLEWIKRNTGREGKQEPCICYVLEWEYDATKFIDNLTDEQIEEQAVTQLKTMANKQIASLRGSSVFARRMFKYEIIEAIRRKTHPVYANDFDVKKMLGSNMVETIIDSDSIYEYEQAKEQEEQEIRNMQMVLRNLNPEKKERYDKLLKANITFPVKCEKCGKTYYVPFNYEQYARFRKYLKGEGLIQDMLYDIPEADRELIMTGTCVSCLEKAEEA